MPVALATLPPPPAPGQVRYFDHTRFRELGVIGTREPDRPAKGFRPFLCIEAGADESRWLALTTREASSGGDARLEIPPGEKTGPSESWLDLTMRSFVDDPSYVWTVPAASVDALSSDRPHDWGGITPGMLAEVGRRVDSPQERRRRWLPGGAAAEERSLFKGLGTITCYRPKPGREGLVRAALLGAAAALRGRRWLSGPPRWLLAPDGTVVEVIDWESGAALAAAKKDESYGAALLVLEAGCTPASLADFGQEFIEFPHLDLGINSGTGTDRKPR